MYHLWETKKTDDLFSMMLHFIRKLINSMENQINIFLNIQCLKRKDVESRMSIPWICLSI